MKMHLHFSVQQNGSDESYSCPKSDTKEQSAWAGVLALVKNTRDSPCSKFLSPWDEAPIVSSSIKYSHWWYSECLTSKKLQSTQKCFKNNFTSHKDRIDIWVKASFWINTTPYFETGIEKCHVKLFSYCKKSIRI